MTRVAIIGYGSIGQELKHQLEEKNWKVEYIITPENILDDQGNIIDVSSSWKKYHDIDAVFLAIPSHLGAVAEKYILFYTSKKIPVITCEKWALSEHHETLANRLPLIGHSATVGGGTRMIAFLNLRDHNYITEICGIVNGTLNYIFTELSSGKTQQEVLERVLEKKYAEPGATTLLEIINGELGDLSRKAIILANASHIFEQTLQWSDNLCIVDTFLIEKALQNPQEFRFFTIISNHEHSGFIGGMKLSLNNKWLYAWLFLIKNADFPLTEWVTNILTVSEWNESYTLTGPGAGPWPTAKAMILDAVSLIKNRK
jgi:homoserine dehydrogenase